MDFGLIVFLVFCWIVYSNMKSAGKSLGKAAQNSGAARDQLANIQARIKEAALRKEFGTNSDYESDVPIWRKEATLRNEYDSNSDFEDDAPVSWKEMTPTQRVRERARQQNSYPGASDTYQPSWERAPKPTKSLKKFKEFKQGSERKNRTREHGRGEDYGLSSRHAPQKDQNRNRRDDWGQRGGGEILSTRNLLIILALGFIVVYVLSKVSPSELGL